MTFWHDKNIITKRHCCNTAAVQSKTNHLLFKPSQVFIVLRRNLRLLSLFVYNMICYIFVTSFFISIYTAVCVSRTFATRIHYVLYFLYTFHPRPIIHCFGVHIICITLYYIYIDRSIFGSSSSCAIYIWYGRCVGFLCSRRTRPFDYHICIYVSTALRDCRRGRHDADWCSIIYTLQQSFPSET